MPQQNDREAEGWPGSDKNRAKAQEDCQGTREIPRRLSEKRAGVGTIPAEQRPGAVAATARHGERKRQSLERHRQAIVKACRDAAREVLAAS